MINLSEEYNHLLDNGVSIEELYIYHLIVNDERAYNLHEAEIETAVQKILNNRYNSEDGLEQMVDKYLDGEMEEEDEWY